MPRSLEGIDRLTGGILRFRWFIMAMVGFLAIVLDVIEHYETHQLQLSLSFLIEVISEGIILPGCGVFLLEIILKLLSDRYFIANYLALKSELTRQIHTSPDLRPLINSIVEFPYLIAPVIGADLLVNELLLDPSETRTAWRKPGSALVSQSPWIATDPCLVLAASDHHPGPVLCNYGGENEQPIENTRYYIALQNAGVMVAILYLHLPPKVFLTGDQMKYIRALAPDMAVAIDAARSRRLNEVLRKSVETERRQITRELHDNMAHSLIYVRSQLELLAADKETKPVAQLHPKLEKIREVIDDVYVDLRATLKGLEANPWTDLSDDLKDFILSIQRQASYRIHFSIQGPPQPVSTQDALQILYIMKEVQANIEKHAQASQVNVRLNWLNDGLLLSIVDNGRGFDPDTIEPDGHMGLKIIKERADEIKGRLSVKSVQGIGTEVSLWLPYWVDNLVKIES